MKKEIKQLAAVLILAGLSLAGAMAKIKTGILHGIPGAFTNSRFPFAFLNLSPLSSLFLQRVFFTLCLCTSMLLYLPHALYAQATEFGVADDFTAMGTDGTADDPDIKLKGFSVFGSTQTSYTGAMIGPGNIVVNGYLTVSSGAYFVGNSTFTGAAKIFITDGSAGQLLRKDTSGYLYWDNVSSLGDNLGNHIATTTLDMGGQSIVNASSGTFAAGITASSFTAASLKFTNNIIISSASAGQYGGVYVSSHVYFATGSNIYNISTISVSSIITATAGVTFSTNAYFSGNVGIGTTTPLYQLHIKGPTAYIAFQDTDDPNGSIGTITSYQSATMYYDANANNSATTGGGHIFRADGAGKTLVTFLNNGNAGIGTISPLKRLDVRGTDSLNATLALTNGWGGAYILMGNQDSGGVNNPSMIMAANGNLQFGGGTNWSDNVGGTFDPGITLLDSGNVGIGTVSPGTKLEINGTAAIGKTYHNILTIGPLGTSPDYFYIDTKIPFTDTPAPQIHITGYNYANTNKAVKVTLSWYEYSNIFNWAQYKSDLGYYNPSRIRLGTYDDAGTARVRIEIANDSTYWSSYFISATDANGAAASYNGWSYTLGEMPAGTGNVTVVSEYSGIVYSNAGRVGIGTTAPTVQFERVCPAGFTNVKAVNNQLGCIQTAENGTATYYNAIRACFTSYGGRLPFSQEFGIAYANFSLTNANNGWEWAGDTAWYGSVVSASVVDGAAISIDACSASYPYRCWIPR